MAIDKNAFVDGNGFLYILQRFINIFATKDELANAGGGDMLVSVYDKDENGTVDKADDADKLGGQSPDYYAKASEQFSGSYNDLTDKPTNFAPATHPHTTADLSDFDDVMEEYEASFSDALEDVVEIASGKCACYVFDTVDALDAAIVEYLAYITNGTAMAETNILNGQTLKTGDVFLIRAVDVPDYWWDESKKSKQVLETTKVELTAISNEEIEEIIKSVIE